MIPLHEGAVPSIHCFSVVRAHGDTFRILVEVDADVAGRSPLLCGSAGSHGGAEFMTKTFFPALFASITIRRRAPARAGSVVRGDHRGRRSAYALLGVGNAFAVRVRSLSVALAVATLSAACSSVVGPSDAGVEGGLQHEAGNDALDGASDGAAADAATDAAELLVSVVIDEEGASRSQTRSRSPCPADQRRRPIFDVVITSPNRIDSSRRRPAVVFRTNLDHLRSFGPHLAP